MFMIILRLIAGYTAAVEHDKLAACKIHVVNGREGRS